MSFVCNLAPAAEKYIPRARLLRESNETGAYRSQSAFATAPVDQRQIQIDTSLYCWISRDGSFCLEPCFVNGSILLCIFNNFWRDIYSVISPLARSTPRRAGPERRRRRRRAELPESAAAARPFCRRRRGATGLGL